METGLCLPNMVLRLASTRAPVRWLRQMRRIATLLLLAVSASTCVAVKPVTSEQLEQMMAAAHNAPDGQVAAQLSELTLIERLSPAAVLRCEAELPGPRARQAFMVLADMSAFLEPPAAEIPNMAKPDPEPALDRGWRPHVRPITTASDRATGGTKPHAGEWNTGSLSCDGNA